MAMPGTGEEKEMKKRKEEERRGTRNPPVSLVLPTPKIHDALLHVNAAKPKSHKLISCCHNHPLRSSG